jgi:hypothetical protein
MTGGDEERILRLVRAAMPPMAATDPGRDLWPEVVRRIEERPRLSLLDGSLAAAMLVLGLFFPRSVLFLLYLL